MKSNVHHIKYDDRVYSFDQLCECKIHNNRWNSKENVHLVFSHLIHLLCVQLIYFASNNVYNQLIIVQHADCCSYDTFKCNVVYMTLQFTSIFCWVCIIPIIIIFGVTLSCILSFYVWLFLFMLQSRRMKKSVYNEKKNTSFTENLQSNQRWNCSNLNMIIFFSRRKVNFS